jgi:hypothetical protein
MLRVDIYIYIYMCVCVCVCVVGGGDRGSMVVKVLFYKSEGRWFDPCWCQWNFSLIYNPSDRTVALGSTQLLTEMSTRTFYWDKGGRCVRLTTYHHPVPLPCNLGTLTSLNPPGHSRPVTGLLYLYRLFRITYFLIDVGKR